MKEAQIVTFQVLKVRPGSIHQAILVAPTISNLATVSLPHIFTWCVNDLVILESQRPQDFLAVPVTHPLARGERILCPPSSAEFRVLKDLPRLAT
jgi:hypothetical protein